MTTLNVGDAVSGGGQGTSLQPYTGKVTKVFIGFVRVDFDRPQGPGGIHTFALTSPAKLTLLKAAEPATEPAQIFPATEQAKVFTPEFNPADPPPAVALVFNPSSTEVEAK